MILMLYDLVANSAAMLYVSSLLFKALTPMLSAEYLCLLQPAPPAFLKVSSLHSVGIGQGSAN